MRSDSIKVNFHRFFVQWMPRLQENVDITDGLYIGELFVISPWSFSSLRFKDSRFRDWKEPRYFWLYTASS